MTRRMVDGSVVVVDAAAVADCLVAAAQASDSPELLVRLERLARPVWEAVPEASAAVLAAVAEGAVSHKILSLAPLLSMSMN